MLFAADELFYLVSSETLKKCFLEGGDKGMCLAGFKLACFVSPCFGAVGRSLYAPKQNKKVKIWNSTVQVKEITI